MLICLAMLACATPQAPSGSPPDPIGPDPIASDVPSEASASEPVSEGPEPCSASFSTNTRVSIPRGTVVIDHFEGHVRTERITVAMGEIARLEHELHAVSLAPLVDIEEQRCSAIFLVLHDGRRILFDDDPLADLEPRARRLAESMGVELAVVRDDADGTANP